MNTRSLTSLLSGAALDSVFLLNSHHLDRNGQNTRQERCYRPPPAGIGRVKRSGPVWRNVVQQLLDAGPVVLFDVFAPARAVLVGGGVGQDLQFVVEDDQALFVRFAHVRSFTPSRLVEDGVAGSAPLEFKEPVGSRDQQNAVPQPTGGLALGGGGHNGA